MRGQSAAWFKGAARFRQGAYRLLARNFQRPDEELFRIAPRGAVILQELLDNVPELGFYTDASTWLDVLRALRPAGRSQALARYESLFTREPAAGGISLLESAYRRQEVADPGLAISALQSMYTRAGVTLAESVGAPDHLSVQLEFVSLLCREEVSAWEGESGHRATQVLMSEQIFLSRRLCHWLPYVAREIEANDHGIYGKAARAAWALVSHDVDFARVGRTAVARRPTSERRSTQTA